MTYLALKNKVKKYIQTEWPVFVCPWDQGGCQGILMHIWTDVLGGGGGVGWRFQGQHASCLTSTVVVVMSMKAYSYSDASILNAFRVEGCRIQQAAWHRRWQWEDNRCKQVVQLVRLPGHAGRVGTCFCLLPVAAAHSPHLTSPPPLIGIICIFSRSSSF